jgi:hypothetical protein
MRRQIRDTDSGQVPRLLETKNNRAFMKKFLLGLSAVVAVLLPLSQNAQDALPIRPSNEKNT